MFLPGFYVTAELMVNTPSQADEAREALIELCARTLEEPGCSIFQLHVFDDDRSRFLLWERFDDERAFELHFTLPHTRAYLSRNLTRVG